MVLTSSVHSFIYLFSEYLLNNYQVLVFAAEGTALNKGARGFHSCARDRKKDTDKPVYSREC